MSNRRDGSQFYLSLVYARGHFLAARALQGMGDFAQKPYAEVVPEARFEVRKAIELEPDLADAYSLLSASYTLTDRDWEAAEQAARKAKELDPTADISSILFARGKVEETLAENRQVLRRDPLNVIAMTNVGRHLATLDRFDESLEWHRKALAVEPENGYAKSFFTWSAFQAGKYDVAAEALVNAALPENRGVLRATHGKGGWEALCRKALRLVSSRPNLSAQQVARSKMRYGVFLKDNEMALDGLEGLEKTNDSFLVQLADGGFRALRQEPRFKALLKRLRYPEAMWR